MAKFEHHKGDILASGAPLIVHQVNCLGLMGAGLAKQIHEKYPVVFTKYKKKCDRAQASNKRFDLLGQAQFVKAPDGTIIVNLFGQYSVGRTGRRTDYAALEHGFNSVVNYAVEEDISVVAIPYKIGCGLGGGDWAIVSDIIKSQFEEYEGTIRFWEYNT